MCLPDSFGVIHVGETFTAYLGALNVSKTLKVTRLTVSAQLQTPSQRWHLASHLDEGNAAGGATLQPDGSIDAIVSHALEEAGQHILRVEVGYGTGDSNTKTLRKFYRFQVSNPLVISELTYRTGDTCCFVSISIENQGGGNGSEGGATNNATTKGGSNGGGMTISCAFDALDGLVAEQITSQSNNENKNVGTTIEKATDLFDRCGRLDNGTSLRYLFKISTIGSKENTTSTTTPHRGIAAGDELGKAIFTWRKACGEMGRMASSPIVCPHNTNLMLDPNDPSGTMEGRGSSFVTHVKGNSGLSVDVAAAAAARAASPNFDYNSLDMLLPVTVEPIDPPNRMKLGQPVQVQFLIVNHSPRSMTMQLQFRLEHMKGISICGPSYKNMEEVTGNGGSTTVSARFVALGAGLLQVRGCCIVDLVAGSQVPQPPLFNVMVEPEFEQQ